MQTERENIDRATVRDFGREWQRFDQRGVSRAETADLYKMYFAVFRWERLPDNAVGFDAGCGTGRWAAMAGPRVGHLHCVDASTEALDVARRNLAGLSNISFHEAPLDAMPVPDGSMDFGYSLGVLHHLPDPSAGLAACVKKLKPGAPMLIYIYYALDSKPQWYRAVWRASDVMRSGISRMPFRLKSILTEAIAAFVYWPLARAALLLEKMGRDVADWPLNAYRGLSFYNMRTDALDRFGTRIEHRMTQAQIKAMMENAGLCDIRFSDSAPFWCAAGCKI
jgi:SAM-dependent methyltransferase